MIKLNKKLKSHFEFVVKAFKLPNLKRSHSHFGFVVKAFKLPNSKRSQIGTTLTWLVAFFLIAFIIVLFLASTSVLAAKKAISPGSEGLVVYGPEGLKAQRNIINLLNSQFEINDKKLKGSDAIIYFLNSKDENEKKIIINQAIKKLNSYCSSYKLLLPNGLITEYGFIDSSSFGGLNSKWTSEIVLKINNGIKIKYKELRIC